MWGSLRFSVLNDSIFLVSFKEVDFLLNNKLEAWNKPVLSSLDNEMLQNLFHNNSNSLN